MGIDLANLKPNVPKVDISEYFILLAGVAKAGKTTLFAKMVEEYYGDVSKGLILACEKGYTALNINAVDINDWDDIEEAVEQLVEEKDELPFKMVAIDTVDILWELAQEATIREWNIEQPTKRTKDINAVGAKKAGGQGFGVGYQRAKTKIRKEIDKLMKAGYGVMAITHSKDKEVEEKSGLTYDQLVVSLPSSARDIFVNMADFINFITIEKERDGDDIVSKRHIYFRGNGYVEAGSRFKNVPERIDYDVTNYINTIEEAIKAEFGENANLDKVKEEQQEQREEEASRFVEQEKKESELSEKTEDELRAEVKVLLPKLNKDQKVEFQKQLTKQLKVTKLGEVTDSEGLAKVVAILESL